jgi:hypothetical protein
MPSPPRKSKSKRTQDRPKDRRYTSGDSKESLQQQPQSTRRELRRYRSPRVSKLRKRTRHDADSGEVEEEERPRQSSGSGCRYRWQLGRS